MSDRLPHVLALDPANKLGWAEACDAELLGYGVLKLWPWTVGQQGSHKRLRRWEAWLDLKLRRGLIDLVAYERPLKHKGKFAGQDLAKHLEAVTRLVCSRTSTPYVAVAPTSVKKFSMGHGASSKEDSKAAALRLWGVSTSSEDVADALCVLHWAQNTQDPADLLGALGMDIDDPRVRRPL